MGEILRVRGGRPLEGTVRLPSAKNSVLPILAAAVLADGPVVLRDVPDLADVHASVAILRALGLTVRRRGGDLHLLPAQVPGWQLPEAPARAMRSSVFYLAPVLHRAGCVRMPMPGGCRLGPRPIDIHLDGLSRMGAQTLWEDGWLELRTSARLQGIDYTLRLPSVGATETLIMAAALAKGDTVLRNVAREPEIRDLADFLNACGARIEGAGQPVIRVQGKTSLHGARHRPIPDRIVAATVAAAVAGCGGCVTMLGTGEDPLGPVADVLERAGCHTDHPALHGYAVAWGLVCELYLSARLTGFPTEALHQTTRFIHEHWGHLTFSCDDYPALYSLMLHDKRAARRRPAVHRTDENRIQQRRRERQGDRPLLHNERRSGGRDAVANRT